jgi:hypothetical protein
MCDSGTEMYNLFYDTFKSNPFFNPEDEDFDPENLEDWIMTYEEFSSLCQHPGRKIGLLLASHDNDGNPHWNTETDECIKSFKEMSLIEPIYSMHPITMLYCNSEIHKLQMATIPENYPVTFRVGKFVDDDFQIVKYLQYTENGSLRHYTRK